MRKFTSTFSIIGLLILSNTVSHAQLKLIRDPMGKSESEITSMMYGYEKKENSFDAQGKIAIYKYPKFSFVFVFEANKTKHLFINNYNNPNFEKECLEWIYDNKFNYKSEKLWFKLFETGIKSNPFIPMAIIKYTNDSFVLTLKANELYEQ